MLEISNELIILIVALIVVQLVLMVSALYDWVKQGQNLDNKTIWLIIIIFISTIGPVLYFLAAPRERHDSFLDDN